MYVCKYVRMYVCMYVCTYVCTYACTYVCMYVGYILCREGLGYIQAYLFIAGIHQEMNWGVGCYGNMGMLMEYRKIFPTIVAHSLYTT